MMRLFTKLSRCAENDPDQRRRGDAETSARELMTKLISEWELDDPDATAHSNVAQGISRSNTAAPTSEYTDIEPERVLKMGFELSAGGPRFDAALERMFNLARLETLLSLLDAAPEPDFAASVWAYLDSRDILWTALNEARIDFDVLERIARRKRLSAADPILDVAERSRDARTRERLVETLQVLGNEIGPVIARRMESARADLRRDLFLFLGKLKSIPAGIDASRFLLHQDGAMRRETIRLMLKFVETRDQAIIAALTETDERSVFLGLSAAHEGGCSPRALTLVRERIEAGDLDSALVTLAIRVLAEADRGAAPVLSGRGRTSGMMRAFQVKEPLSGAAAANKTMTWLVGKVARKSRFLRRWQLRPKSPEMLASLAALAAYWNTEPHVQEILGLARSSGDSDLKKAIAAPRVTAKFKAVAE